jgi:hypothetical protein
MTPDIDTLLREADPAARVPAPEAHGATGDAILARVLTRPGRRLPVVAALVALVVLAGGAAFALLINDQVDSGRDVMCYSAPSIESLSLVQSAEDVIETSACEGLWESGVIESPGVRLGDVPRLEACVLPSRTLAVFPADDPAICDELTLDAFEEPIDVRRGLWRAELDRRDGVQPVARASLPVSLRDRGRQIPRGSSRTRPHCQLSLLQLHGGSEVASVPCRSSGSAGDQGLSSTSVAP